MKNRLAFVSVILSAAVLSGCAKSGTSSPPSEPERSMTVVEGAPQPSVPESTAEGSGSPNFPVKNEGKLKRISIVYDQDEKEDYRITEILDDHNNCIMEDIGGAVFYYAYEYDDDGNILKKYELAENYKAYEYENGLITKEYKYEDGELYSIKSIQYNEHGDDVLATIEDAKTGYITTGDPHDYEYDENGKWIVKKWYHGETNEAYWTETCVRDEGGNIISLVTETDGTKETCRYKYDENGNQTEQHTISEYNDGKKYESRVVTEYDAQNRETRISHYSVKSGRDILEYRHDISYTEL